MPGKRHLCSVVFTLSTDDFVLVFGHGCNTIHLFGNKVLNLYKVFGERVDKGT
jgi:hypothetical protein